jgi:NAD(P)-dependent dehydrogenase (short-subunit alcohol dehydrogenase family)
MMSPGPENRSLADKIAVVTGASSGIGRAIALAFARAGAAVACLDIDRAGAEETAQTIEAASGRALSHGCDVSVETDTLAAAAAMQNAWGAVRVLVHAAAADDPNGTVADIRPSEWDRVSRSLVSMLCLSRSRPSTTSKPRLRSACAMSVASFAGLGSGGPYRYLLLPMTRATRRTLIIGFAPSGVRAAGTKAGGAAALPATAASRSRAVS